MLEHICEQANLTSRFGIGFLMKVGVGSGDRHRIVATCALVAAAVIFGGGGRSAPFASLIVQLFALGCMAFAIPDPLRFLCSAPRFLVALIVASLALPLLHSIPMPPDVWRGVPGRDLVFESMQLSGDPAAWRPFSVDQKLSLLAFVGLVPPLAVLMLAWDLPPDKRSLVSGTLILVTGLALCVGAIQLASAGEMLDLYMGGSAQRFAGFFANHNSAGLYSGIMLCLLIGLRREDLPRRLAATPVRLVLGCILFVSVLLTQSRSSIGLLVFPCLLFGIKLWRERKAIKNKRITLGFMVTALVFALVATTVQSNDRFDQIAARFESFSDARPQIWYDGMVSAERFWPVGSGMGTFDEVFQVDESLESVGPRRAGRAHNDYLEIAIEAGVPGLTLLAGWIAYLAWQIFTRARDAKVPLLPVASAFGLAMIAAQSVVDYPLRNATLLCIGALLVVFLHDGDTEAGVQVVGD